MQIGNKSKAACCILSFAIIVNVFLSLHIYSNFPDIVHTHDNRWVRIAQNLYNNGVYSDGSTDAKGNLVSTLRAPPVYPLIMCGVYYFCGIGETSEIVVRILLVLLNIGIVYVVYRIGSLINYYVGCIASFLTVLDFSAFFWANNLFIPDTLLGFIMALFTYFLVKFIIHEKSYQNIIYCSIFLGLASLTKSIMYMCWIPISIFIFVFLLRTTQSNLKKNVGLVAAFLIIQLFLIGGYKLNNYITTGYSTFSSQTGDVMLFWNASYLKAYQNGTSWYEEKRGLADEYRTDETNNMHEAERSLFFKNIAKEIILSSPLDYAIVVLKRTPKLFLGSPPPDYFLSKESRDSIFRELGINGWGSVSSMFHAIKALWGKGYCAFPLYWLLIKSYTLMLFLIAVLGMLVCLLRSSQTTSPWLVVGAFIIIAYIVVIVSPSSHARYRAPLLPVLYVFGGYFIYIMNSYIKKCRERIVMLSSTRKRKTLN